MGHNDRHSLKGILINILLIIVLVLLLAIPAYFCYKVFVHTSETTNSNQQEDNKETDNTTISEDVFIEEITPNEGNAYVEYLPVIEDQQAYVIAPKTTNAGVAPTLIIYSHGSNTNVTKDLTNDFMSGLQEYGKLFTQYNYIFAASNEHDVNWGNDASLRDIQNLISWVSTNYDIQPQVYLMGFSMGGLPTMNFATQNSEEVSKIALLAPTVRLSEWNQQRADLIKDMNIKVWHGTADTNIPISNSIEFIDGMKDYNVDISFEKIPGKTHFDLDTEYMNEVLDFFNS